MDKTNTTDPQVFALNISEFVNKAKEAPEKVVRKVATDVATSLVMKSPVGDATYWKSKPPPGYVGGRFRANWVCAFNQPADFTTDETDPSGEDTIDALSSAVSDWDGGDIYFTNSLPYAIPLEYGHSDQQAPNGMVRLTVNEWDEFVINAARDVENEPAGD